RRQPAPEPGWRVTSQHRLGLRENLGQFVLLVVINAFVGSMVGLERTVLPLLGEREFGLTSKTAITSFIVSFGVTKAVLNLVAAHYALRPQPFYLGIVIALGGLGLSLFFARETLGHVRLEASGLAAGIPARPPSLGHVFFLTSIGNASLFAACQAGLVNNLND